MRCQSPVLTLLVAFFLIAGCASGDDTGVDLADETEPAATQAPPSTAATSTEATTPTSTEATTPTITEATTLYGSEERTVVVGDSSRSYLLFTPSTLDSASPAPLVLSLHGLAGSAGGQEGFGFNSTAEREGIVVAYPDAIRGAWDMAGTSDIEFIAAIIDEVTALVEIDQDKVYAMGYSQGGSFSTFLTCHLPDQITAIASVTVLLHHDAPACPTHSPARILTFVGETDRVYSIEEGLLISAPDPDLPGPLADETGAWAATNGCDPGPTEESLPAGVVRQDYDCPNGSALTVYVHPGGHVWPAGFTYQLDANEIIWEFFEQYTTPLLAE